MALLSATFSRYNECEIYIYIVRIFFNTFILEKCPEYLDAFSLQLCVGCVRCAFGPKPANRFFLSSFNPCFEFRQRHGTKCYVGPRRELDPKTCRLLFTVSAFLFVAEYSSFEINPGGGGGIQRRVLVAVGWYCRIGRFWCICREIEICTGTQELTGGGGVYGASAGAGAGAG